MLHLAIEYLDVGARDGSGISRLPVDTTTEMAVAREWVESPPKWVADSIKKGHLLTARKDSPGGSIVLCSRTTQVYKTRGPSLTVIDGDRVTRKGQTVMTYEFGAPRVAVCARSVMFAHGEDAVMRWGYDWRLAWSKNNNLDYLLRIVHDVIGYGPQSRCAVVDISEMWVGMLESNEASQLAVAHLERMRTNVAAGLAPKDAQVYISSLHKLQHLQDTPSVSRMVAQVLQVMYRAVSGPDGILSIGRIVTGALAPDPSYEDAACALVRSRISLADIMVASLVCQVDQ